MQVKAQENMNAISEQAYSDTNSDLTQSVLSQLGNVLAEATGKAETQVVTNDSLIPGEQVSSLIADMSGTRLPGSVASSFV